MQVSLKIKRFNPEAGQPPHYDTFIIPDAEEHDSILDLLECIRGNQDGTLVLDGEALVSPPKAPKA